MLVVGHPGVADVQGERHQEELDGWSNQARPFALHPGVDVQLHTEEESGFSEVALEFCPRGGEEKLITNAHVVHQ